VEISPSTVATTLRDVLSFDSTSFRKYPVQAELARAISTSLQISERNYDTSLNNITTCSLIRDTCDI
jgi:hypothetical protein